MRAFAGVVFAGGLAISLCSTAAAQVAMSADQRAKIIARSNSLELPGTWREPPGNVVSHAASSLAKQLCSNVFISKMTPKFAEQTLGDTNAVAPIGQRVKAASPIIDFEAREVRVSVPGQGVRTARLAASQGCVALPADGRGLRFRPSDVKAAASSSASDGLTLASIDDATLRGLDHHRLKASVDAAFLPDDALTQAVVVTWKGRVIAERYGPQAGPTTPLEGWSMGKSIVATLLGGLILDGTYSLDQPAPIPEWSAPDDARRRIRIRDLLQMSSGLRIRAEQDPDYVADGSYPDHWYYYTGPNAFAYAASRSLQYPPGTVGRYRNTDPVLAAYLVRLAVEKRGENYHAFPQKALFDRIGIRTAVLETDAHGNFLTQGYNLMSARDWARLGNLYLQDGVWNGVRLLPEGYVDFVRTVAPAWQADERPIYGGFFWLNRARTLPVPEDAFYMAGAGGQFTVVIPSRELVIVRLGRYAGGRVGLSAFETSLKLLMDVVPTSSGER